MAYRHKFQRSVKYGRSGPFSKRVTVKSITDYLFQFKKCKAFNL